MPNHVTNLIESSERVISAMRDDNGLVDFNLIIPIPKEIDSDVFNKGIYGIPEDLAEKVHSGSLSEEEAFKKLDKEKFINPYFPIIISTSPNYWVVVGTNKTKK